MKEKGFTLVELLVAISIIAILPTVVIANFPRIRAQFALSRASYKFSQDLRKIQDKVLSAVEYRDSGGTIQPVGGYGVYVDITGQGDKKYIIYADSQPSNLEYDGADFTLETIDFSSSERGVIIKEIRNTFGNKASINFAPPNSKVTITQLGQNQTSVEVVFGLESDPSYTKTVSINTAGLIEIND